jgi:hypothetical protein
MMVVSFLSLMRGNQLPSFATSLPKTESLSFPSLSFPLGTDGYQDAPSPREVLFLVVAEPAEVEIKDRLRLLQLCRQCRALLSDEVYRCVDIAGTQIRHLLVLVLDTHK